MAHAAESAEIVLKVLPSVTELLGTPRIRDARDLRIEDLLGRQEVVTDLDAVGRLLADSRVLITGAGGSIGSEIARQVAEFAPATLLLLDHDETHLHDVVNTLHRPCEPLLADIRNTAQIERLFAIHRPDVVFHAAAHKHVPLLEEHACEAVRTNVLGTLNVIESAARHRVAHFVFISTDKAVRPSSVMGASKNLGEQLVLTMAPADTQWSAVRFGNVVGSRGSVIPTFARQIAAGGPVTVTDARMTRFFMSIEEAVQLVLQTATFSAGGEVFMLEMGEAVNILQLAQRMIRLAGFTEDDIPIVITGVRPGEKVAEELRAPDEIVSTTPHPDIVRLGPQLRTADVLRSTVEYLRQLEDQGADGDAAAVLRAAASGAAAPDRAAGDTQPTLFPHR